MKYYTLCISSMNHDSSFALFCNDRLISFLQAERITRVKNGFVFDPTSFDYIHKNITDTIDLLIIPQASDNFLNQKISNHITKKFKCKKIVVGNKFQVSSNKLDFSHHTTHAISAFYMSPFEEANCLIVDALGSGFKRTDPTNNQFGVIGAETTSIIHIDKNYNRNVLYKRFQYVPAVKEEGSSNKFQFSFAGGFRKNASLELAPFKTETVPHLDIGNMYTTISKHLSFGFHGAGKVMGLSAYGNPNNDLPPFLFGNTTLSNNNLFTIDKRIDKFCYPELHEELTFQKKADMAYEVQKAIERVFLHHAEFIKNNSESKNLVFGGGCALNILAISAVKEKFPEFNIFVDPIANDATHSIGMGIHCYKEFREKHLQKQNHFDSIYLGPKYDDSEILKKIDLFLEDNTNV